MSGPPAPRFLALGDSYTIGEAVLPTQRWPVQLAALLDEHGTAVGEPRIIATTGWTTADLAHALDQVQPVDPCALVSLLIGVNNQYQGLPIEEYRPQFAGLLDRAVGLAGGHAARVLVLSIPDWGATPFAEGRDRVAIASEIDAFNAVNRDETERAGARYVDVTPVSRLAAAEPALIAGDGLHPSGEMYRLWAELALAASLAALAGSSS